MAKKAEKTSRFYCYKEDCPKSVWTTPEYLTEEDWRVLRLVTPLFIAEDTEALYAFVRGKEEFVRDFFDRVWGWPEGYVYCRDWEYFRLTAMGMVRRERLLFQQALEQHDKELKDAGQ